MHGGGERANGGRGVWLYNQLPATASQISSKEATEHAAHSTSRNAVLGPGESIEYTKHRVSLEGHPWPGCHPEVTSGIHIVMDRPSKRGA